MLAALRMLVRPVRAVRAARAFKAMLVSHLRQLLDLQREMKAEVRELHETGLLAAIHVIAEQQRARAEAAQEYARPARRVESLERRLGAAGAAAPADTTETVQG